MIPVQGYHVFTGAVYAPLLNQFAYYNYCSTFSAAVTIQFNTCRQENMAILKGANSRRSECVNDQTCIIHSNSLLPPHVFIDFLITYKNSKRNASSLKHIVAHIVWKQKTLPWFQCIWKFPLWANFVYVQVTVDHTFVSLLLTVRWQWQNIFVPPLLLVGHLANVCAVLRHCPWKLNPVTFGCSSMTQSWSL